MVEYSLQYQKGFYMHKILIIFAIFVFSVTQAYAYSIKVYDEYGNRVGTYRKEGDNYQFYDFNDKKVDSPEMVIKDAPDKKTLTEYSRTFYDSNMNPIGTWRSGYFGNNGRFYPRGGIYYPSAFYGTTTPYIVRPSVKRVRGEIKDTFVDTRFARFHKFEN